MRLATCVVLALAAGTAMAADAAITLGAARVRYDDTRWNALASEGGVRFEPIGDAARKLDPVKLHVAETPVSCAELASRAFAFGHYDSDELAPMAVKVGGVAGERFEAHTRCRNATPKGVVICVKRGGVAYLLQSLNPGCHGRNLFSAIDPLDEIAGGLTFTQSR